MITEVCRFCRGANKKTIGVNALTKEAITALADSFGHLHLVQTHILNRNVNHADDVAEAKRFLERNEALFIAEMKAQFQYTDEQIETLKATLSDCECDPNTQ